MTDIHVEHTESASVRSTVSTASSGYAIVSVPNKARGDVRHVYPSHPAEPPPDYDDETPVDRDLYFPTPRLNASRQSSPRKELECKLPLLSEETVQTDAKQQTIVRINSRSQDINIEIVSNPAQSPSSTTADSSFLYKEQDKDRKRGKKCCNFSTREKVFLGGFIFLFILLVLVILNFTACIGNFTSACE